MYVNNHYTGHRPSKTKPNPTHECKKCHVFKVMMFSLLFGKARAQQESLPRQHSVLVLPSGRNKVENSLALGQSLSLYRLHV